MKRSRQACAFVFLCAAVAASPAAAQTKDKTAPRPVRPKQYLNQRVLDFCTKNVGRKVGNGQCAVLAEEALKAAGARRFPPYGLEADYVWGRLVRTVNPKTDGTGAVQPGDILQFRDAYFYRKTTHPDGSWEESYNEAEHHTAVVERVYQKGKVLVILGQNTGPSEKEEERLVVQRETINFAELQKGWVKIYRPVR
jgi:hypothetical protein